MDILVDMPPIAAQHVSLFGSFEFSDETVKVDQNALTVRFAKPAIWSKALSGHAAI